MSRGVLGRIALVGLVLAGVILAGCGGGSAAGRIGPQGRKVNRLDPVNPKAVKEFEAAMRALRLGGPEASETAKARLKAALEIDPKLWEAWHDLGVIHYRDGEDGEAITAFGKALGIIGGHTPTLLARAEAHRRANHKKEARNDYEAALRGTDEDDPNRRDAAARLASLLRDAGDYDDAVAVLRETVRISGVSARIYTELGLIYIQQKRFELANLVLAKAVELDTGEQKDPAIYNALALLALRQGRAQEAFERFDYAASLDATYIDARFNKASVLLDAGDYARAKVELAAIVEKRTDDYAAQVALGVAHRGLNEHKEAAKTWDRVIKEAPRRSTPRADAMFNVALLKLDFLEDAVGGKADLDRYLQEAPTSHSRRQAAEEKRKELGK
ncbi:MAG: tetratricopeptide repeat protein [Myxococcota bacterium]|nr:tetratricopeptide repeat protein [Myxococcota bacterium]